MATILHQCRPAAACLLAAALLAGAARPAAAQTAVITSHHDLARTGWNHSETVLTPANVAGGGFGLQATVTLDAQVNAQPLVVPGVKIAGDPNAGMHDVVYVATNGDTVYAIDPTAGTVLLSRTLGTPVPPPPPPLPICGTPSPGTGIMGTPVIDLVRRLLYLVAFTQEAAGPTYTVHALSLSTLADAIPPVVVAANQTLTNGANYAFDAPRERQRPALLEANNVIYAGFGSICDGSPTRSRGWLLGFSADTLQPVSQSATGTPLGELTNRQATAPDNWFLSSVWMAGAGPAADASGVYFTTGNSDKSGLTYDGVNNIQNSVIKLAFSTASVLDLFTPSNVAYLDQQDQDFSAGGVMLLPSLGADVPPLATAAGKFGTLFLLNRNSLGGYTAGGPDNVLASVSIGQCWCVELYFAAPRPTVVTSGGRELAMWQVTTKPGIGLVQGATAIVPAAGPNAGFFTSVSSNGASNPIIWAVLRPASLADAVVTLVAYGATPTPGTSTLPLLFSAPAGPWDLPKSNAFIMPVVANGRVYVASDQQLAIFGLGATTATP